MIGGNVVPSGRGALWKLSLTWLTLIQIPLLQIYIHSTEETAGLEQSAQHSWDRRVEKVSFSVKHTYTTEDARQLSIRQRRCVFADEQKLETSSIYTYSTCMRQCRMQRSRSFCKCVPHFYPPTSKHWNVDKYYYKVQCPISKVTFTRTWLISSFRSYF